MERLEFIVRDVLRQAVVSGLMALIIWLAFREVKLNLLINAGAVITRFFYVWGWANGRTGRAFLISESEGAELREAL